MYGTSVIAPPPAHCDKHVIDELNSLFYILRKKLKWDVLCLLVMDMLEMDTSANSRDAISPGTVIPMHSVCMIAETTFIAAYVTKASKVYCPL